MLPSPKLLETVAPAMTGITVPSLVNTTDLTKVDPSVVDLVQDRPAAQIGIEVSVLILIWLGSILGNSFVCIVINRSRRIQSTTNYFVVSLAVADLALAVLCIPFIASRVIANSWLTGQFVCKFARFIQFLIPCVNFYILVSISIDRFYTIIYPLTFKVTKATAKRMILFCWLAALTLSSFCFYFFSVINDVSDTGRNACPTYAMPGVWSGIVFILFVFFCEVLVPVIILLVCYIRVFRHIWKVSIGPRPVHRTMNPVPRTKVKVVIMLIIMTLTSTVLYVPFYISQLWYCLAQPDRADPTLYITVSWMVCSASVTRPLIYLCYNANFRRGCKEVLCMSTMHCYRRHTYAITNASAFGKRNHIGIMETSVVESNGRDSPSKTFNRSIKIDKTAWPLPSVMTTNYI